MSILCYSFFLLSSWRAKAEETPFNLHVNKNHTNWTNLGKLEKTESDAVFSERKKSLQNLFSPQIDPYTGKDTVPDWCKIKNLPPHQEFSGIWGKAISLHLYSSGNNTIGACEPREKIKKVTYFVLYCGKESNVYIIRYFYAANNPWHTIPIASCK